MAFYPDLPAYASIQYTDAKNIHGGSELKGLRHAHSSSNISSEEPPTRSRGQSSLQPQGIGMAVAFDWGLAVQILIAPFLPLFLSNLGIFKSLKLNPPSSITRASLISLPFTALFVFFGEGVRRGWRWVRPIQIGFNALAFLGGFAFLPRLWQSSRAGNYWPLITAIILLIFPPLIAWRLSRPATVRWFATVSSTEARKRHGGSWLYFIALWAIVGGILQAIASLSSIPH